MKMNSVMKMFGVFGLLAFLAAGDIWATPTIEVTKAQQRYPWNNKIDVDYASAGLEADHTYALSVILECAAQGLAKTVSTDVVIQNRTSVSGTTVVDIDTVAAEFQGLTLASGDLTVAVALADRGALDTDNGVTFVPGDYLIVDLQDGTVTPSNNVTEASAFQDVVYKTTKMVFRKVPAGSFMMQATGAGTGTKVEIPQDYYLAIYPCTQGQYKQLAGGALPPAIYQGHDYRVQKETSDTYPSGWVQWNQVAGGTAASSGVDSDILTILNGRMSASGYTAALPNEAQWERAARAGTTTTYFFGSSSSSGLGLGAYASYGIDADPANQTFGIVGGKLPNAWGFYDIYGNVWEWCSDAYEGEVGNISGFYDLQPGGSAGTPNSQRVQRGGSYSNGDYPNYLSSTFRCYWVPDAAWYNGGFRLALAGGITRFLSEAVVCPADTRDGVRVINSVDELLPITYSGSNWGDGSGTATVTYSQNGAAATTFVDAASSTATQAWTPTDQGTYQFTHSSTAAGATDLSATFIISGVPVASASVSSLEFDTRLWWPRQPESVDQILPFAHDMTWTNDTVSIVKVSIAPYKNVDDPVETVEARRETVSANQTTTGTGIWTPVYGGLYQAQIIREVSGNVVVTNTVDIDLRTCPGLEAVRVTFADGTTMDYQSLAEALDVYRSQDGKMITLLRDCPENLVLAAGDDIRFDGGTNVYSGTITVADSSKLRIYGGYFTEDLDDSYATGFRTFEPVADTEPQLYSLQRRSPAPMITLNSVQQRYPWNGMVDIDFTIANVPDGAAGDAYIRFTVTENGQTRTLHEFLDVSTLREAQNGTYRVTWNSMEESQAYAFFMRGADVKAEIVWCGDDRSNLPYGAAYLVVDLAKGQVATAADPYPVSTRYFEDQALANSYFNKSEYKSTKMVLRLISGGTFTMGAPSSEQPDWMTTSGYYNPETEHSVTLTQKYLMGLFEVTQAQYYRVMGTNPSALNPGSDSLCPVENVSYAQLRGSNTGVGVPPAFGSVDAGSFMGLLAERSGIAFDLPTEAQWEFACRAGTTSATYATGGQTLGDIAWYAGNSGETTHAVGSKAPNAWGLYDTLGNVWEMCRDRLVASPNGDLGSDAQTDPLGAVEDGKVPHRGGSWYALEGAARAASRHGDDGVEAHDNNVGFRLSTQGSLLPGLAMPLEVHEVMVDEDVASSDFDTRDYEPRTPESGSEILPFAYDTDWVADAETVVEVSIAPYNAATNALLEVRRETVVVTNTVGTGIWTPVYKGIYQARITQAKDGGATEVTTVDIDLSNCPDLRDFAAVRVTFPDGSTTNYLSLAEALEAYRGHDGERFELLGPTQEDLVLEPGDELVFEGNGYLLDGAITVPSGADLTILDGRFTADPRSYLPTQGTTQPASAVDGVWTVESLWQVGAAKPADVKAYLDDGNLVFIGSGDMQGWGAAVEKLPPWDAYDAQVTNAVVRRLVTSVGSEAFSNCTALVSATLPGTIQDIGRSAFAEVNTSGTDVEKGAGFVNITYAPEKDGLTDNVFEAKGMRMVDGKLTGGTYDYDPAHEGPGDDDADEVDPLYLSYYDGADVNTWTIDEAWATIGADDEKKYRTIEDAVFAAEDGEIVNLKRGIAYTTAAYLNEHLADKPNAVVRGPGTLDVWGTLTTGKYECPIRLSDKIGSSEITGGDFYGPVYTKDGAISGGTFSVRPDDSQIKEGYVIVETSDEPARYRVVEMPLNGVAYPKVVENISYTGENLVGVLASSGVVLTSGVTNAVDVGVYTAKVDVAEGKCWPTGGDEQVTLVWGIAPALPGVVTGYDPNLGEEGGWRITLTNDVTGPLTIPDSFGEKVHGAVVLDLNGFTIKGANGTQPAETADGHPGLVISHTPDYEGPALDLTIEGPGSILGGDGADGDPANHEGGDGAPAVVVEEGASLTEGTPKEDTTKGAITKSPGEDGSDYVPEPGEPSGLLVTIVDSRDEYLALAIPYANTNSPAGTAKPTLDSLVRKAELAAGDAVYIHNPANKQIAKYVLDAEKYWHPVPVIEVTERGWTSVLGQMPCELEPGYGFWLQRGAASRPNKVYLWGHEWTGWSGAWTVTIDASTTVAGKAVRGKTLIGSPYHDAWDLNDTTRVNWSGIAENGDWIQTEGGAGMIYKYYNGQWKPYSLGAKMKPIPAGCGFWYIRAAGKGSATLVFAADQ